MNYEYHPEPELITQEWLDMVFIPLEDYLVREFPDRWERKLCSMMFMCFHNGTFQYKNIFSRQYIIIDTSGHVVQCGPYAVLTDDELQEAVRRNRGDDPE